MFGLKKIICVHLLKKSAELGLDDLRVVEFNALTDGQATSTILSSNHWLKNSELLIYNIDTYVKPEVLTPQSIQQGADGWGPCIQATGVNWSFLNPDKDGREIGAAEKNAFLIMHRLIILVPHRRRIYFSL